MGAAVNDLTGFVIVMLVHGAVVIAFALYMRRRGKRQDGWSRRLDRIQRALNVQ